MEGSVLQSLARDERVAAFAPIAFGDVTRGYPIIGTTAAVATRWGHVAPSEGRLFAGEGEAVIGAAVDYRLGESITPSHCVAGQVPQAGRGGWGRG
ncbi:hypothetical protein FG93_02787 [Bosea sp. LC85]|uniref:hypothetical protein n=1 Tax=Bosea sp. LC85 TaxID=1502851 RepID=UPI0004E36936|nr:hypothetical protein [Bosea sp. LC85]KFC70337.1 hypothetical protein FG93_02787 [Bosea sp. LC85]